LTVPIDEQTAAKILLEAGYRLDAANIEALQRTAESPYHARLIVDEIKDATPEQIDAAMHLLGLRRAMKGSYA
jgi:hypothetical protein